MTLLAVDGMNNCMNGSSINNKKTNNKDAKIISDYLSRIGRKGGLKGGVARASNLTPERRKEIAEKAVKTRWSREKSLENE